MFTEYRNLPTPNKTMKRKKITTYSKAYLRWRKQLFALKKNDLYTVKQLANEAREYFLLKETGKVQLRLS